MESPQYYAAIENFNYGLFTNLDMLKSIAKEIKDDEVQMETREQKRLWKKLQGEFDIDSDEELQIKEKEKKLKK